MTAIHRSALVAYSVQQMFELVDDIDRYAEFLPWCGSSRVLSRDDEVVRATIEIRHGGLHKAFTTRNRIQRDKVIEMRLEEGPFRHLDGLWRFDPLGERACKVQLDLDFDFSSRVIAMVVGPVFNQIAGSLVDAFTRRAVEVYGKV